MSAHAEEHFAGSNKLFTSIWVWLVVLTLIEIFPCLQTDANPLHADDLAGPFDHQGSSDCRVLYALEV